VSPVRPSVGEATQNKSALEVAEKRIRELESPTIDLKKSVANLEGNKSVDQGKIR
jgi:hypothetical protein